MREMLLEYILLFKTFHLVGMVGWFGGMFYLVRIFVYHVEAFDKPDHEAKVLIPQYQLMESRVYRIICNPGMIITWIFGLLMLYAYGMEWFKTNNWMHAKLTLVFLLSGYLGYCKVIIRKLATGERVMSSFKFRLFNEVPSIFLLSIILLAVYQNYLQFGKALIGILIFGFIIFAFARFYKSIRK